MIRSTRFRPHGGAIAGWIGAHALLWTAVALAAGVVDFLDSWKAVIFGAAVGLTHALVQWWTTVVVVADGMVVSRNFGWVRRIPVDEIELVQRVRHRNWSGVALQLRNGEEVLLAAPLSSVLAPNPNFDEDLHRFCATIAFGDDAL